MLDELELPSDVRKHQIADEGIGSGYSVESVRIADAVRCSLSSNRLSRRIIAAEQAGAMPIHTIGAYIAGLPDSRNAFRSLHELGDKSLGELSDILERWHRASVEAVSLADFITRADLVFPVFPSSEMARHLRMIGVGRIGPRPTVAAGRCTAAGSRDRTAMLYRVFGAIPFPAGILAAMMSTRLRNALHRFANLNGDKCPTLAAFLDGRKGWITSFSLQKNVGRISQDELLGILETVVGNMLVASGLPPATVRRITQWFVYPTGDIALVKPAEWEKFEASCNDRARSAGPAIAAADAIDPVREIALAPEAGMRGFFGNVMAEREFDVVNLRFGLDGDSRHTLEEVGQRYGLTRERIRQIEASALNRCRLPIYSALFATFLETQADAMLSTIVDSAPVMSCKNVRIREKQLTGLQRVAVRIACNSIETWLDSQLEPIHRDGERIAWISRDVAPGRRPDLKNWLLDDPNLSANLPQRIRKVVRGASWPLGVSALRNRLPDIPESRLRQCLRADMGAELDGDTITALPGLGTSIRLVLTLRHAGRPMQVREARALYRDMFDADMKEHAVRAVLQRMPEAIIVERGTYALRDHIELDEKDFLTIRDIAHARVTKNGRFMSVKILRRSIAAQLPARIDARLTAYLLLGVCQDDPRFAVRRGLMIGSANCDFSASFVSLAETVSAVVREHGPITIAGIRKILSDQRDVLGVSVNVALKNTPDIVMLRRGLYDMIDRVIGDALAVERLARAIQIVLLDGPAGLDRLTEHLAALQIRHNPITVLSFVRHMDGVALAGKTASLIKPDPVVAAYDQAFQIAGDPAQGADGNRTAFADAFAAGDAVDLTALDYRLA